MHTNILLPLLFLVTVTMAQTNFDQILNSVFTKQDKISREINDAIFDGDFFYMEKNNKGEILKTINSRRQIYTKGSYKQKSVYTEMKINGRLLSKEEMQNEIKKSRGDMQTKLPFVQEFRDNYLFSYSGETNWNGQAVWKIDFQPKHKAKDNIKGFAYILQSDTNIVQYQFIPTGLPFVLKNFNIVLDYSKVEKYWVPTKFMLDMELDVKVLISFSHKFIHMQEQYSNFKFNNGLSDDFFTN